MDQFDEGHNKDDESKDDKLRTDVQPPDTPIALISSRTHSFLMNLLEDADILSRSYRVNIGPLSFDLPDTPYRIETREKIIQELDIEFNRFFFTKLIQQIPEGQLAQFLNILDHLDAAEDLKEAEQYKETFSTFLEQNIPYLHEVEAEIFFEFRHIYLDGVAASRSKQDREQ